MFLFTALRYNQIEFVFSIAIKNEKIQKASKMKVFTWKLQIKQELSLSLDYKKQNGLDRERKKKIKIQD